MQTNEFKKKLEYKRATTLGIHSEGVWFSLLVYSKRIAKSTVMRSLVLLAWCFCLFAAVSSQGVGTQAAEEPLNLPISVCTAPGNCQTEADAVVLDSNWRWAHTVTSNNYFVINFYQVALLILSCFLFLS